jgi:N6-adenosine-specific RNA methylase IME4
MKYNILLADPPWTYNDQKSNKPELGGITYPVMTLKDICNIPVQDVMQKDSLLFLWATMPLLPEALSVISSWGYTYTTCAFVWVKINPSGVVTMDDKDMKISGGIYSGLGHWVNGNAELVLMGKRGSPKRLNKNVKQIIIAPRSRHSKKPDEVYRRIENVAVGSDRLELFGRGIRAGWKTLGNEITGNDIYEDIRLLS